MKYKYLKIFNLIQSYCDLLLEREKPKAYPVELSLGTTSFCNLKCVHCPREGNDGNMMPYDEHIDMAYFKKLEPYLKRSKQVSLYGLGEPMIDKGYFDKVRLVNSFGSMVSLSSNGTLLDERRCKETIESGIAAIGISLDASTEETFAVVRPPGGFYEIVENIKRLVQMKKEMGVNHPRLMLSFGIMRQNVHDLPGFADLAIDIGCDELVVHPVIYMSRKAREEYAVDRDLMLKNVEIVREKMKQSNIPFYFWDLDTLTYLKSLDYARESGLNGNNGSESNSLPIIEEPIVKDETPTVSTNGNHHTNGNQSKDSKPPKQKHYCHFLWRNAMLQGKGELFPCCYMTNIKVGEVQNGNLIEMRAHPKLANMRKEIKAGNIPKPCQSCPQLVPYNRWEIIKQGVKEIRQVLKG